MSTICSNNLNITSGVRFIDSIIIKKQLKKTKRNTLSKDDIVIFFLFTIFERKNFDKKE